MQNYRATTDPIPYDNGSSGRRLAIAGAFTAILVIAMMIKSDSAETAIIGGAALFGVAYALEAISHSPLLITRTIARIDQETQLQLRGAHLVAPYQLPTDRMQYPTTAPGNFVEPVDMTVAKDAALWAISLYGPDGQADPHKVSLKGGTEPPGRLKVAAPASAAKEFLLTKRVLQRVDHGYRLNIARYPTADTLRDILG